MRQSCMLAFLVVTLLAGTATTGCRIFDSEERYCLDLVYTDSISVDDTVTAGRPFHIVLRGWMPDPSWTFDHTEVERSDSVITLRPIGRKDLTIRYVIQITVAWEDTVRISLPEAGTYTLRVLRPRGESLLRRIVCVSWRPRCGFPPTGEGQKHRVEGWIGAETVRERGGERR